MRVFCSLVSFDSASRLLSYVGGWLSFVRTVLLTSEALSAELLRMLLVEQRGWIIAAMDLGDKLADVVVQGSLARCRPFSSHCLCQHFCSSLRWRRVSMRL